MFTTTKSKRIRCPLWNDDITVTATYCLSDNHDSPYQARLMYSRCEILENIHRPISKKDKKLGLYTFCDMESTCPCLKDFAAVIDPRDNP